MAYVTVPKDLDKVKNKIAFNLTLRQIVCFSIAGVMGVPLYFMTRPVIGVSNACIVAVLVMLPAFFFAMFEKDGQTAEKILFDIIKVHFLRPGVRKKDSPHNKGQAHIPNKKQITAQDTIPYREMSKDGICRIRKGQYSKLIRFHDISYSLASKEDQDAIFEDWSEFHNYFDSSIPYSITLRSRHSDMKKLKEQIQVVKRDDEFSEIAREYSGMVQSQLSKGNNGRLIEKYITY
nr:PrgI family protein [Lachnospiraceae bacterium]